MKKKTILLLIIQIIELTSGLVCTINAQWINQISGTNRTLYDVEFLNDKTGWVVGVNGTIKKTTNGGKQWQTINHPAGTRLLSSIHLIDSNYAYVVGDFETIIKTSNGGNNWEIVRIGISGQGDSYEGVFFVNKDTGWICGTGEKVLKTTNGGLSFDSASLFWGYLQDMFFKDANTGVLVAELGGTFKTTNGGSSWFRTQISLPTNQPNFRKVSFINSITGWIVGGDGRVFRTENFGSSWDSVYHLNTLPLVMYCAEFIDSNTGWVAGEQGRIYRTSDSGNSWNIQISNTSNLITSLSFFDNNLGWGSCGFGGIIHTSNGGMTLVNEEPVNLKEFFLFQNYPNPFNQVSIIKYQLQESKHVSLSVHDISGKEIIKLVGKKQPQGQYSIEFDGKDLSSGIYLYRLKTDDHIETRKMILQK